MRVRARCTARRMLWSRFHPLVRVGWHVATAGKTRPTVQTAAGIGMVCAGFLLGSSRKAKNKPIYSFVASPGDTTRIRVFRGTSAPSETLIRT